MSHVTSELCELVETEDGLKIEFNLTREQEDSIKRIYAVDSLDSDILLRFFCDSIEKFVAKDDQQ